MSWDIVLEDEHGSALPYDGRFCDGGVFPLGGESSCRLSVTYNYSPFIRDIVGRLDGKTAEENIDSMRKFVLKHKDEDSTEDYWEPCIGNARVAIERLLSFAERHPKGVWKVL